jgi:hypothetical protein
MEYKIIFSLLASILGTVSFFPYIRDVLKDSTRPHVITWMIWAITQGTATAGIIYGHGKWGALELAIGTLLILVIFVLSIRRGTKDITYSDYFILFLCLVALSLWILFNQPVSSILLITIIDLFGLIPTLRKTYNDPHSETLFTWLGFALSNTLAIAALQEYNSLTLLYLSTTAVADFIVFLLCWTRRKRVAR